MTVTMDMRDAFPSVTPETLDAAERSAVGEALFNPPSIRFAVRHAAGRDFSDRRLGQVYDLIVGMVAAGFEVNAVTVAHEIARRARAGIGTGAKWLTVADLAALTTGCIGVGIEGHARIIREAAIRREAIAAARTVIQSASSNPDAGTIAHEAIRLFTDLRDGNTTTGIEMKTLGDVLDGPDDYDWLIPGLLESRDRLILTGMEGLGKSVFLRQLAVMAAAGIHPTKFAKMQPVRVAFIDVENSERQWRRKTRKMAEAARRYGTHDPMETLMLACVGRMDITGDRDLANLHRILDEHDPQLMVIGPLYKLVPRAIQTDDEAAPVIAALDSLRDRGVALLMEAHAGKGATGSGDRDMRPRGSAALLGWPEFGLGLTHDKENKDLAHLVRWRGDRDERAWPTTMTRGGPWPWTDIEIPDHIRRNFY